MILLHGQWDKVYDIAPNPSKLIDMAFSQHRVPPHQQVGLQ